MKYNVEALFQLVNGNASLPQDDKVGCAWVAYQLNSGDNILLSECNEAKKKCIKFLVEDNMLELHGDNVTFSVTLDAFMAHKKYKLGW